MDNTEVVFTEIWSNTGNVNKKIEIFPDGTVKKTPNAQIYSGKAKTVRMGLKNLPEYLESLNSRNDTAIVLGIWGGGEDFEEYDITTDGKQKPDIGLIARTQKFFKFANNDSVSLMYWDIDDEYSNEEINRFISELEKVLQDSLIGTSGQERTHIMRFQKLSTSSGVRINGKSKNSYHIYFPVKNAKPELLDLMFEWTWLRLHQSHKVKKGGKVSSRTIIDQTVKLAERLCFENDAELLGSVELAEIIERKCDYYPGGIIDCELAVEILAPLTVKYPATWAAYSAKIASSPECVAARTAAKAEKKAKRELAGDSKSKAVHAASALYDRDTILSSEELTRSDGTSVSVYEILLDRDSWINVGHFLDPIDPKPGTNKAMVMGDDDGLILHSFDHGEVIYHLKFDREGILRWLEESSKDEVHDCFDSFIGQADMEEKYLSEIYNIIKKIIGVPIADIKKSVKDATIRTNTSTTKLVSALTGVNGSYISPEATHNEIADDFIFNLGEAKSYGYGLYTFDKSIWKRMSEGEIYEQIGERYKYCRYCKKSGDYTSLAKLVLTKPGIYIEDWPSLYGIPCASKFWQIKNEDIVEVDYTSDMGCRFKLGFNPDWEMKTPYWDMVVANVVNPICFQQAVGLALSGYLTRAEQMAAVFKGEGGSGKGTTNRVISAMLPKGRTSAVSIEGMSDKNMVMDLVDSVINFIPEIRRSDKELPTHGFKMATGGDTMNAWKLYNGIVKFRCEAAQVININEWPTLDSRGGELQRRLGHFIVEFKKRQEESITLLDEMIIEHELPGVLAWAIDGIRMFFMSGMDDEYSLELFDGWVNVTGSIEAFMSECVTRAPERDYIERPGLWKTFVDFCVDRSKSGSHPQKGRFMEAVKDRYPNIDKSNGEWKIYGIKYTKIGLKFAGVGV